MKKLLLSVAALCCAGVSANAWEITETRTYYGEYASGDVQSPCLGATTRKCATVTTTRPFFPGGGPQQYSLGEPASKTVVSLPADTPWQDYVKMKKLEDPAKGIYVVLEKDGDNEN